MNKWLSDFSVTTVFTTKIKVNNTKHFVNEQDFNCEQKVCEIKLSVHNCEQLYNVDERKIHSFEWKSCTDILRMWFSQNEAGY